MTEQELELLLDRAAKRGAQEALKSIGLSDENAYHDMKEIRNLLDAWRATKQTVGHTIARVITTAILTALAAGIWMNWGDK
jgi:hypothetical protein